MKTTPKRRELVNDAISAGYSVRETESRIDINVGKTYHSVGITIWKDGVATRNDILAGHATAIRTIKLMRRILELA